MPKSAFQPETAEYDPKDFPLRNYRHGGISDTGARNFPDRGFPLFRYDTERRHAFGFHGMSKPPAAGAPVRVGSVPLKFSFTILRHLLGEHPK